MMLTGLSGNEIYCLALKGWAPSNIVVGNSVHSMGVFGGLATGMRTLAGGEIQNLTTLISEGRHAALRRLEDEAQQEKAHGMTGVTSDLKWVGGLIEFLAIGSAIHAKDHAGPFFTTACSGQDLYCQMDAGYHPRHFVIGNVVYALGVSRGLLGIFRQFAGGEVKEYSDMYNHTRHLALQRLEREAHERGANAVVDITTRIVPFGPGVREMLMVGTASYNPVLGNPPRPVTSELTGEELWNLTQLGYAPVRLVLGTSVYALGFTGGVGAFFQSLGRGEIDGVTRLIYQARENCLAHIRTEAEQLGADAVIGVKVFVNELGRSLVEVMAIGTAVKRTQGVATESKQLIPQAVIRDRDTFFDETSILPGSEVTRKLSRG
jgi:uncharacterized protein YbjQ (UPF0145 family)